MSIQRMRKQSKRHHNTASRILWCCTLLGLTLCTIPSEGSCRNSELSQPRSQIVIRPLIASTHYTPAAGPLSSVKSEKSISKNSTNTKNPVKAPPTLKLSLREALNMAIYNNRELQIANMFPSIARTNQQSTAAIYDPTIFAESSYYQTDRPIQSTLDNGTDGTTGKGNLEEDQWYAKTGLRKQLSTGGIASVFLETDHLDSNSELVLPNPQYTSRLTIQLRQALLKERGDKSNKTNIELADINTKISEEQYRKNLLAILRDVAIVYWRFKYYYEQLQISENAIEDAEDILARLHNKKKLGLANMLDLDRADAVLKDRQLTLYADKRNYTTAMDQLKLLLGISHNSSAYLSEIQPTEVIRLRSGKLDRLSALEKAIETRPEVEIARLTLNSSIIGKNLAKHKLLPTLDATASYTHNALGEDAGDTVLDTVEQSQISWSLGFEFEYSLGNDRLRAELRKAKLLHRRNLLELNRVKEQLGFEINTASSKIEELSSEIEAATGVTKAYSGVLKRETTRFELAKIDNQRLLDAQDDFFNAKRNTLRASLNLNIAMLDLSWAKGSLMEDLRIKLNSTLIARNYNHPGIDDG